MKLQYKADEKFFTDLLCKINDSIDKYLVLFDFRDPNIKRKEFNSSRKEILTKLLNERGKKCELSYEGICDINSGIQIDHMIPLSSNILNKKIRKLKPEKGKKIKTQSFGSNDERNLLITCSKCNGHKKHRFLDKERIKIILRKRFGSN